MLFALVSAFAQDPAPGTPGAESGPIILPALEKAVIDSVIKDAMKPIACSAPDASRSVRFVITEAGTVEELRLVGKPTPEEVEEACVRKVFASAHFTSPGERMAVYYAMVTAPR